MPPHLPDRYWTARRIAIAIPLALAVLAAALALTSGLTVLYYALWPAG